MVFRPAAVDTGIIFVRTDLPEAVQLPALAPYVTAERGRRTTLKVGNVTLETIEHCMAAIQALGIDNLIAEVSGPELPAPDASAVDFFATLKMAGVVEQEANRRIFVVKEPVGVSHGDASLYALPIDSPELQISYDLDYAASTGIGRQMYSCRLTPEIFEQKLAPARTFLLEEDARQLQAQGVGKHISAREVLVLSPQGPINNKLRFPNECVRHKVVDLIGDLGLVGRPLQARIVACKSGHALNQQLATKLYDAIQRQDRLDKFGTDAILDIRRIQKILPHRFPFLLVDKIIEIDGDIRIRGVKNVTFNELFFQGHFPGTPIMPGVLIVEAMAQVSGLLFAQRLEHTGKLAVLLSMDGVKLRKAVVPGDQLILCAETVRLRRRTAHCRCTAMVGDIVAAEADIKFMLLDDEKL